MTNFKKTDGIFRNTNFLLLLIVLFGLSLRLIFFSGMGISDSLAYSKAANDLNLGKGIDPNSTLTLSTRLGLVYATAFSYSIFGINEFSAVLFPLLASIAGIILIFYFGKLLFNEKIGLLAAFLLSFFPLEVVYSTQLLSDLPSAFFMSLGVYVFLYAELKKGLKYGLSYLLSGILIGIGYMIRESALLIALFFAAYMLYKRRIKKWYFLVPLGVILVFALESLIFFSLTNDALFRFHASQKYLRESVISHNYFGRLDFPTGLFHYPWLFLTNSLLAFFYMPVFIAALCLFFNRRKESALLLLWFIPLLVYLSFGSSSLADYLPFKASDRYTEIFTMPAILLLAFFLTEKNMPIKRVITPLAIIILLSSSIAIVYVREDRSLLSGLKELHPFVKSLKKPVYIDDRSLKALGYISEYSLDKDLREYPNDLGNIKDSYVIINKEMIENLKVADKKRQFPKEIENPPANWQVIKERDNIKVYYLP